MRNYEKYADEIKKYNGDRFCNDFVTNRIIKDNDCEEKDCNKCILLQFLWLMEEYEDLEEQGYRMVNINKIIEQLEELEKEYPYRVVGEPETYSQYNEGWRDCIDRAIGIVEDYAK